MRIITLILSIYVFALAAVPCSDSYDCNENETAQHDIDHSDHEHEEDHCSPFCICSCCGSVSTVAALIHFDFKTISKPVLQNFHSPLNSRLFSSFFYSIWQPPKLTA